MSVNTSIALQNQMTPVLQAINSSLNYTISTIYKTQEASGKMFDVTGLNQAKEELAKASVELNKIESEAYEAAKAQEEYNNKATKSNSLLSSLAGKVIAFVGVTKGLNSFKNLSDEMTMIDARLESMLLNYENLNDVQNSLFQGAQRSRGDYVTFADSVAKLRLQSGDTFSSMEETAQFVEQMNKQFIIAGTSQEGMKSAMYQLNQAMAMGVLRGEEFNAINENANGVIQLMADYLGVSKGQVRELAFEGKITGDVIKNTLLGAAEETNRKFNEMPMTFAQIGTQIKNVFIKELQPALDSFNEFLNTETFKESINNIASFTGTLASVIGQVVEIAINGINIMIDYFQGPMMTLIGIIGLYKAMVITKAAAEKISAFASSVMADGLIKATGAQLGLNTAILTSPIFWIPALIIGIIGLIFGVVGVINKVKGESISAIGVVVGALNVAVAFVYNIFGGIWNFIVQMIQALMNGFISMAEFIGNVFINPVGAVKKLFYDLVIFVTEALGGIARAVDSLLGTDFSSSINTFLDGVHQRSLEANVDVYSLPEVDLSHLMVERKSYEDAYNSGYSTGENLQGSLQEKLNELKALGEQENINSLFNDFGDSKLDKLIGKTGEVADNTKGIKDELSWDNNSLIGIRDLMQSRAITELSKDVKIQLTNEFSGTISKDVDVDEIIEKASNKMIYDLEIALNGGV